MKTLPWIAVLLGGCWPYLPGSFDDYADGGPLEGPAVIGWYEQVILQGDYWSDGASGEVTLSQAVMSVTDGPSTWRFTEFYGAPGTCTVVDPPQLLGMAAAGTVRSGPQSIAVSIGGSLYNLQLNAEVAGWGAANVPAHATDTAATVDFEIPDAGTVRGTLYTAPGPFNVISPELDGEGPSVVPRFETEISWAGHDRDDIVVQLDAVDAEQNFLGTLYCNMPNGTNFLAVDPGVFPAWGQADGSFVRVFRVRTANEALAGSMGARSQMASVYTYQGFVFIE